MKKLIILLSVFIIGCSERDKETMPLEKLKNKGIIIIENPEKSRDWRGNMRVRCKTKDSVFNIELSDFDAKELNVGDTIK